MGAPQFILLGLLLLGLGMSLANDGEVKPERTSFFRSLISFVLVVGLLWWGGFFR